MQRAAAVLGAALLTGLVVAAAGAGDPAVRSVKTLDRDRDGHLDALRLTLRRDAGPRQLRALKVRGYRVRGAPQRTRGGFLVGLFERHSPDTGARPAVLLGHRLHARDGAPPILLAARLADTDRDGALDRAYLRFSERVSFPGTRRGARLLTVAGHTVTSVLRARGQNLLTALLEERPGAGSTSIRLKRRRAARMPVDRAGNPAIPRSVASSAIVGSHGGGGGTTGTSGGTTGTSGGTTGTSGGTTGTSGGTTGGAWHTLSNPIDPRQQTNLAFGQRSHWLQPWRAYLDTPPAARLRDAVGINFNVGPSEAPFVARLLADSGFRRARVEIPWGDLSYDEPTELRDPAAVRTRLSALKANGIRPLILLNSNHGRPCQTRFFDGHITQPAAAGARQVQVDDGTAQALIPGLSGFNGPDGKAADYMVKSVSGNDVVELSKPLPISIPAGTYRAATLRYPPFTRPLTSSGAPSPSFERTLSGWLDYVSTVTRAVRDILGGTNFDVEVWNEGNFGADFLWIDRYYDPVPSDLTGRGDVEDAILRRTVAWLRDPQNGVTGVGIGDGFANQTPFHAGSTSPVGLTALDKHPYHGAQDFPGSATFDANRPLDALGQPDGSNVFGRWIDSFLPSYRAFFPEYYLSGIQTETLVRDLSPITTAIGDVAHGRYTKPQGASVPPDVWITETALHPGGTSIVTPADKRHLQAKATLRDLTAFVNKGVSALYFYAVGDGDFAMLDPTAAGGGETMMGVRRLTAAMTGPRNLAVRRSLALKAIADRHDHVQFAGDDTAEHPSLYNRDVVAFLPFQADDNRFVVPAYVMTRDMSKVYKPSAPSSDPTRYDLPPETYRLTVGGLHADRLTARATDPLTGSSMPVTIVSRSGDTAVLEVLLTDSPRLLVLED